MKKRMGMLLLVTLLFGALLSWQAANVSKEKIVLHSGDEEKATLSGSEETPNAASYIMVSPEFMDAARVAALFSEIEKIAASYGPYDVIPPAFPQLETVSEQSSTELPEESSIRSTQGK